MSTIVIILAVIGAISLICLLCLALLIWLGPDISDEWDGEVHASADDLETEASDDSEALRRER
jgi:hypothetical protein